MSVLEIRRGKSLDKLLVSDYLDYREIKYTKLGNMNCSLDIYISPEDYLLNKYDIDSFAQVEYKRILNNYYICFDEQLNVDFDKFRELCERIRSQYGRL